jgi:excisionase family DNA binding protein
MKPDLLDVPAAAEYLTTTERHIRRLVHERRVAFHKLGSKLRFDTRDLDKWLEQNRVEASR